MECPYCQNDRFEVVRTIKTVTSVKRIRRCLQCSHEVTTKETVQTIKILNRETRHIEEISLKEYERRQEEKRKRGLNV